MVMTKMMMMIRACRTRCSVIGLTMIALAVLSTTANALPNPFPDCPTEDSAAAIFTRVEPDEQAPSPAPSMSLACQSQTSNARGWYTATKAPCIVQFHKSTQQEDDEDIQFRTSDLCDADNSVITFKDYPIEWKDECVGDFSRCYSLEHHQPILFEYMCARGWKIPEGTTHISMDCSRDKDMVVQSVSREEMELVRDHKVAKREHLESKLFDVMLMMSCFVVGVFTVSNWIIKPLVTTFKEHHPPHCKPGTCRRRRGATCECSAESLSLTRDSTRSLDPQDYEEDVDCDDGDHRDDDHFEMQVPADFDAVPIEVSPSVADYESGVSTIPTVSVEYDHGAPIPATVATDYEGLTLPMTVTPSVDYDGVPIAAATVIPDSYR